MKARRIGIVASSTLAIVLVGVAWFWPPTAGAEQPPSGAELRLAARANSDGSVCVGVQWREDKRWRGTTPRRCQLPSDAAEGVWYASSTVPVPMDRVEAEIRAGSPRWYHEEAGRSLILSAGDREWRIDRLRRLLVNLENDTLSFKTYDFETRETLPLAAEIAHQATGEGTGLVRVLGRRTAGNAIELGLQRLVVGDWPPIDQPSRPIVIPVQSNQWVFTESFITPLMPPVFRGELRGGATIDTVDGSMQVTVDGQTKSAQCGVLGFDASVTIAVHTRSKDCQSEEILFSICSEGTPDSACDLQQFQVYKWEHRHTWPAQIELSHAEMAQIVQAVYTDYVVGKPPPEVARSESAGNSHWSSGDHTVYMWESHMRLKVLLHETAHVIVDGLGRPGAGHGADFAAVNLSVFSRYAPLVDTRAMREDAKRVGVLVAEWTPRPVSDRGIEVVRRVICGLGEAGEPMCDAFGGAATESANVLKEDDGAGHGSWPGGAYWTGLINDDVLHTWVYIEAPLSSHVDRVARLDVSCSMNELPKVRVSWRGLVGVDPRFEYQFGSSAPEQAKWHVGIRTWGEEVEWSYHQPLDSRDFIHRMAWSAVSEQTLRFSVDANGETFDVTFPLEHLFETPVQNNLIRCGATVERSDPDAPVIDHGRFGEDFWWGVVEDDDPLRTYVATQTTIVDEGDRVSHMLISCAENALRLSVYWDLPRDPNRTIRYLVEGTSTVRAEWNTWTSTWHDSEFKGIGSPAEDAADLIRQLAWAAQSDGTLTVEVHERSNPNRRYTATFDLDGLFDTPVQPNLARCGT